MFVVSVVCCQVELITCPEEYYRLWCVVVCDLETSWMRRPWTTGGCRAKNKQASKGSLYWSYNADHCKDRSVKWETSGSVRFFLATYQPQKRHNASYSIYILRVRGYLSFTGEWVAQSYKIQGRTVDCIGHILRRNCLDTCYCRKNTKKCIRDAKTRTKT
jgi:hypothetical protein